MDPYAFNEGMTNNINALVYDRLVQRDRDQRIAMVFSARDVLAPDGRFLTRRGYPGGCEGPITGGTAMRACVRRSSYRQIATACASTGSSRGA